MKTRWFVVEKVGDEVFVPYYRRNPNEDFVNGTCLTVNVDGDLTLSGPLWSRVYKDGTWVKATVVSNSQSIEQRLSLITDKNDTGAYYL